MLEKIRSCLIVIVIVYKHQEKENYSFYKVTHTKWDFRDDCTEFIRSFPLHLWFPATVNIFLSLPNHLFRHKMIVFKAEDLI